MTEHEMPRGEQPSRVVPVGRRGGRNETGNALLEFALVLPILMALLLGVLTGGQAYNRRLQITHATREGARYGATVPANQTFTNANTWAENVRQLIVDRSGGDLTISQVCVSLVQGSGGTLAVVATPNPATWYSTGLAAGPSGISAIASGQPCIPGETYPVTTDDVGRRVQVTSYREARLEFFFGKKDLLLRGKATGKAEGST